MAVPKSFPVEIRWITNRRSHEQLWSDINLERGLIRVTAAKGNTAQKRPCRSVRTRRADYDATLRMLDEKSLQAAEAWFVEKKLDPAPWNTALEQARHQAPGAIFSQARNLLLKQGLPENQFPPRMLGWTPEEIGLERIASKGLERLHWEFDRYEPVALSVYSGRTPHVTSISSPVPCPPIA